MEVRKGLNVIRTDLNQRLVTISEMLADLNVIRHSRDLLAKSNFLPIRGKGNSKTPSITDGSQTFQLVALRSRIKTVIVSDPHSQEF